MNTAPRAILSTGRPTRKRRPLACAERVSPTSDRDRASRRPRRGAAPNQDPRLYRRRAGALGADQCRAGCRESAETCARPPRQALDCGSALRQSERRSRAGVFRRRDGRGDHHSALWDQVAPRDRPQLELRLRSKPIDVRQVGRELGVRYAEKGRLGARIDEFPAIFPVQRAVGDVGLRLCHNRAITAEHQGGIP
jgi:hypothetical protein